MSNFGISNTIDRIPSLRALTHVTLSVWTAQGKAISKFHKPEGPPPLTTQPRTGRESASASVPHPINQQPGRWNLPGVRSLIQKQRTPPKKQRPSIHQHFYYNPKAFLVSASASSILEITSLISCSEITAVGSNRIVFALTRVPAVITRLANNPFAVS